MDLYGQDPEANLISRLVAHLDCQVAVDVGAERGALAAALLDAGIKELHLLEPHPDNASVLRTRFRGHTGIVIHECAASDGDGNAELHVSSNPDGTYLPWGHTLLERDDTDEILWRETIGVPRRSLRTLILEGKLPARVGILKIDTEGHDLAVLRGAGELEADVVMVEHWSDLPHGLGACPWTLPEMVRTLEAMGLTHFAFILHRGEFVTLKWDDGEVERGSMGNLIFLRDSKREQLMPAMLQFAGWLSERAAVIGQRYMDSANERLTVVKELKEAADERLALINELEDAVQARSTALVNAEAKLRSQAVELDALKERRH